LQQNAMMAINFGIKFWLTAAFLTVDEIGADIARCASYQLT
jgi:hypothetical protein